MKRKKILALCLLAVFLLILAAGAYAAARLPEELSLPQFARALAVTDLKGEPFAEVSPGTYFLGKGSMPSIISHLETRGLRFHDQLGSLVLFSYNDSTLEATLQAVTRFHSLQTFSQPPDCLAG